MNLEGIAAVLRCGADIIDAVRQLQPAIYSLRTQRLSQQVAARAAGRVEARKVLEEMGIQPTSGSESRDS